MSQATIPQATIRVDGDTVTATTYAPTATLYVDYTGKRFGWVLDSDLGSNSNIKAKIVETQDGSRALVPKNRTYTANDGQRLPRETLASLTGSLGVYSKEFKFTSAPMEHEGVTLDQNEQRYLNHTVKNWPLTFTSKNPEVVALYKKQMSTASSGAVASESDVPSAALAARALGPPTAKDTATSAGAEGGAE